MAANSEKIKKTMEKINESLKSTQQSESEKLELEWKNVISTEFETIANELQSLSVKVDSIVTLKDYLEAAKSDAKEQIDAFKLELDNFKTETNKSLLEKIESKVEALLDKVVITLLNKKFPEFIEVGQKIKKFENFNDKIAQKFKEIDSRLDDDESILATQRRHIQGDLEEAIAKNEENIKRHNELLVEFQEHIKHLEDSRLTSTRICHSSPQESPKRFDMRIPKFKGEFNARPVKFLNYLRRYVNITKPVASEMSYILSQAFEGSAKNWFEIYESEITSFEDLESKFCMQYWNESHQRNARKKLEFGQYLPNGKMTRSEYALDLLSIATELKDSREESDIISQISMHFEREVRGAIRGLGTKNKRNLLLTLTDFDNEDTQNRLRNGTHETQDKPASNFGQNQNQSLNPQYSHKPNYKNRNNDNYQQRSSYNTQDRYQNKEQKQSTTPQTHEISAIQVTQQEGTEKHLCSGAYSKVNGPQQSSNSNDGLGARSLDWPKNT